MDPHYLIDDFLLKVKTEEKNSNRKEFSVDCHSIAESLNLDDGLYIFTKLQFHTTKKKREKC